MTYEDICASVRHIKRSYGETNPFHLCRSMGIVLLFESMGTRPTSMKGFFIEHNRICSITVNSDLPDVIQRIIVAHELCHAINHRESGAHAFHEVALFNESNRLEKEANLFAAELLLEDEDVFEILNQDGTFFTAASELCVPMELLDFKFRVMKWKGFKLIEPPITARSNFLRDMEIPENTDDQFS